jgi:DNA ligase-1
MKQFKPMLASPAEMDKLRFPLWLSPKLDGIRALVINGVVMSRSLKPIPNQHVQEMFSHLEGYDGELIVGDPTDKDCFRNTTSGVMSRDGKPDVNYHVFDRHDLTAITWEARYQSLSFDERGILVVPHYRVNDLTDIEEYEALFLLRGYEGVMLRDPDGPYKNGRSTAKEGWLLKVKRFEDGEALVIGMEEKLHNGNEATVGELGQTKRTSHQENLVPLDTMGALIVRDLKTGVSFNIGTGFTDEDRDYWWNQLTYDLESLSNRGSRIRDCLEPTEIIKYRYFPSGSKDKPRFPTFLGIRNKDDM